MSFLSSFQQFVSDAGSSLSECARKLVTNSPVAGRRDSAGVNSSYEDSDVSIYADHFQTSSSPPKLHLPLTGKGSLTAPKSEPPVTRNSR